MNLTITLGAETYLPLRAIPIVTSGLLDTPTLAHMISDPEAYCDDTADTVLSVFAYQPTGKLLPASHLSFASLQSKSKRESPIVTSRHLPEGMLVKHDAVWSMFNAISHSYSLIRAGLVNPAQTVWNDDPQLSAADRAFTLAGLPIPRLNSAASLRARILDVLLNVEQKVEPVGIIIDRSAMPGTRGAWSQLIGELDERAARSADTHKDHFSHLGLRWRPGSRPEQINPIRIALNLSPI